MKTRLLAGVVLFSIVLRGDGCVEDIVDNPQFQLWSGDDLVGWSVERGAVAKAPTWHSADLGVALVGDDVLLVQTNETTRAPCFQFDILADVEPSAEVELQLDFQADDRIEYRQPVASENFEPLRFRIKPPSWYDQVRILIRKVGEGSAILGHFRVSNGGSSCLGEPIALLDRPIGVPCDSAANCSSGYCTQVGAHRVCSLCAVDGDCREAETCGGVLEAGRWPFANCIAPGINALGHPCRTDAECRTGICCRGLCSECCTDGRPCAEGTCEQRNGATGLVDGYYPHQCKSDSADTCFFDDDCRGVCGGQTRSVCSLDDRSCSSDDDCQIECVKVGTIGGQCQ